MFVTSRTANALRTRVDPSPPEVIVVEKDDVSRSLMANVIARQNYAVQTTGSAADVMEYLLHGGLPVIVIGEELEEGINRAKAIELLKCCNPKSTIILVSDEISPTEEIQLLKHGIFYRTLRPASATDWVELQWAVDCACNTLKPACAPDLLH
jgi:DNA-binding NtrC family response regulator